MDLDTASVRFGRVTVDGSSDSGLARIEVNKPAPGPVRVALLPTLRKAGCQRCELVVNDGLEAEPDDGEDADDGDDEDDKASTEAKAPEAAGNDRDAGARATVMANGASTLVARGEGALAPNAAAPGSDGDGRLPGLHLWSRCGTWPEASRLRWRRTRRADNPWPSSLPKPGPASRLVTPRRPRPALRRCAGR